MIDYNFIHFEFNYIALKYETYNKAILCVYQYIFLYVCGHEL